MKAAEASHGKNASKRGDSKRHAGLAPSNLELASPLDTATLLLQRKCACGGGCASCQNKTEEIPNIQPKLKIGAANDKYEQEADRVAHQVMRMRQLPLQRQVEAPDEEQGETVQTKPIASQITPLIQRQVGRDAVEDEEELQAKELSSRTPVVTPQTQARINSLRGGGQPLRDSLRSFFEPRFGADFSQVRVHNDQHAHAAAQAVNAKAFTLGNNIVFGSGEYAADADSARHLLAHELTHTIQQSGTTTTPTIQRSPTETGELSQEEVVALEDLEREFNADSNEQPSNPEAATGAGFVQWHGVIPCVDIVTPLAEMAKTSKGESPEGLIGWGMSFFAELFMPEELDSASLEVLQPAIDTAIQYLEAGLPDAEGPSRFAQLFLKSFLKQLKQETNQEDQIEGIRRLLRIISRSPSTFAAEFNKGLAVGFVVDGLLGYVQLILDAACIIPTMLDFAQQAAQLVYDSPEEIQQVLESIMGVPEAIAASIEELTQKLQTLDNIDEEFRHFVETIGTNLEQLVEQSGQGLATAGMTALAGLDPNDTGYDLGRVLGSLAFDVVLTTVAATVTVEVGGSGSAVTVGSGLLKRFMAFLAKQGAKLATKFRPILIFVQTKVDDLVKLISSAKEGLPAWTHPITDKIIDFLSQWKVLLLRMTRKHEDNKRKGAEQKDDKRKGAEEDEDNSSEGWRWFKSELAKLQGYFLKTSTAGATKETLTKELKELKQKVATKYGSTLDYSLEEEFGYLLVTASFKGESGKAEEKIPLESQKRWEKGKKEIQSELNELGETATREEVEQQIKGDKEDFFYTEDLEIAEEPPYLVIKGVMNPEGEIGRILDCDEDNGAQLTISYVTAPKPLNECGGAWAAKTFTVRGNTGKGSIIQKVTYERDYWEGDEHIRTSGDEDGYFEAWSVENSLVYDNADRFEYFAGTRENKGEGTNGWWSIFGSSVFVPCYDPYPSPYGLNSDEGEWIPGNQVGGDFRAGRLMTRKINNPPSEWTKRTAKAKMHLLKAEWNCADNDQKRKTTDVSESYIT